MPEAQTLKVETSEGRFELSVGVSRLAMSIPRGGLEVLLDPASGATTSPRYFHLFDRTHRIELSGWFESADGYPGFDPFWQDELAAWDKAGVARPSTWTPVNVDRWEGVLYDVGTTPARAQVRAEWVESGTWIDLHLSVSTPHAIDEARASVLEILKAIRVRESR